MSDEATGQVLTPEDDDFGVVSKAAMDRIYAATPGEGWRGEILNYILAERAGKFTLDARGHECPAGTEIACEGGAA